MWRALLTGHRRKAQLLKHYLVVSYKLKFKLDLELRTFMLGLGLIGVLPDVLRGHVEKWLGICIALAEDLSSVTSTHDTA